jgi:hypothetical protein
MSACAARHVCMQRHCAETLCRAGVGMGGLPVNPNALIWNLMLKVKTLELELIEQLGITQKIWYVQRSQV